MVTVPRIEIRVVILGNVSAGKTTLVNALFKKKYGEVSTKRTTAGIHHFRIHSRNEKSSKQKDCEVATISNDLSRLCTADGIFERFIEDNMKRLGAGKDLSELYFDVVLEEPLVRCRDDTNIVLIDVPGINEAGVDNKYVDYVSRMWTTFDCVIVTMDGKQGVNTEEQVYLLKFVQEKLAEKDIPVIILCNKIDDPYDEELAELVDEARKEVEKIFSVSDRREHLERILNDTYGSKAKLSPVFIPLSAGHAFVYHCGSQMNFDEFKEFDQDILYSFGRNQIGQRKWNKLSVKEKVKTIYDLVHDETQLKEGIEDSNYDSLVKVLDVFLGGHQRQNEIIRNQLQTSLSRVDQKPHEPGRISKNIKALYELMMVAKDVDLSPDGSVLNRISVFQMFWSSFDMYKKTVFNEFKLDFPAASPRCLAGPFTDLINYYHFVNSINQDTEKALVLKTAKEYVQSYFIVLFKEENKCNFLEFGSKIPKEEFLSACRWKVIWNSILLVSYDRWFCESFGQEKIHMEHLLNKVCHWWILYQRKLRCCIQCSMPMRKSSKGDACAKCDIYCVEEIPLKCFGCGSAINVVTNGCNACPFKYKRRTNIETNATGYCIIEGGSASFSRDESNKIGVEIPSSLSCLDHYGYLPQAYCHFIRMIEQPLV